MCWRRTSDCGEWYGLNIDVYEGRLCYGKNRHQIYRGEVLHTFIIKYRPKFGEREHGAPIHDEKNVINWYDSDLAQIGSVVNGNDLSLYLKKCDLSNRFTKKDKDTQHFKTIHNTIMSHPSITTSILSAERITNFLKLLKNLIQSQ